MPWKNIIEVNINGGKKRYKVENKISSKNYKMKRC